MNTPTTWASLDGAELEPFFAARARDAEFRAALETLLLELPRPRSALLTQRLREGRAGFLPLLSTARGRTLLVGDACSGSALALGRCDLELVVADVDARRLAFARERDRALAGGRTRFVVLDPARPLPFRARAFALTVDERGAPTSDELAELARVTAGETLVVADNRLAYKRSSGRRADFRLARPLELARRVLRPERGERTLAGWRRASEHAGLARPVAFALYPHRLDFSHVVALDSPEPRLTVGPKERANRAKLVAESAGLFPVFTPSYALHGRPASDAPSWYARLAAQVAADLGTRTPDLEHLITTRGNTCVLLTRNPGWCLHAPLSPAQERQSRRHFEALGILAERFPDVPAPRPLHECELDGRYVCVEERLGGLSAPQLNGDLGAARRTYADLAQALARLAGPPSRIDDEQLARLVERRLDLTAPVCGDRATARGLERIAARLTDALRGLDLPLVLQHSDLRAKHVQVDPSGAVLGLMDLGSHAERDLPLFDLVNLILHDRKQQHPGWSIGDAWRHARAGGLRDFERAAIGHYAEGLGLTSAYVEAVLASVPLLIGAMAEGNWDYSRPRWIAESFGSLDDA